MQKTIKTEQIEIARAMAGDFIEKADCYSYQGEMGPVEYCNLIGLDYDTVRLLGPVSYTISYQVTAENKYQLACMTYIEGTVNEKLSVSLEGDTDFMGFNTKASDDNLENFLSKDPDEIIDWINENRPELWNSIRKDILDSIDADDVSDCVTEDIAYSWIENNPESAFDRALDNMSTYDLKDRIKDAIDEL